MMAIAAGGGYEYDFETSPPDRLVCKICFLPCCEPEMSVCCGNNFCKSDVEKMKKATNLSKACPTCRNNNFLTYINKQADREIRELRIYCPNKSAGCKWIGEVKDVCKHLKDDKGCLFQKLPCPHKCGLELQRQDMPSHIEADCSCYCQYCRTTADKKTISAQHKEKCGKFPLPCPNRCGEPSILHENLDKHRKVCPEEPVRCIFQDMGCTVTTPRKNREEHNSKYTEKHLELTKQTLSKKSDDLAKVTTTLATKRDVERLRQEFAQMKIYMEEIKKELARTSEKQTHAINAVDKKVIALKQEAKNELAREVNKMATKESVQMVQKELDNSKKSIADNSSKITAVETDFKQTIQVVNTSIENAIQRGRDIFTTKSFVWFGLYVAIVIIAICIAVDEIKMYIRLSQ